MRVQIKASDFPDLELFPNDEIRDIIQNILCILKTAQGSCPGLRGYGLDPSILHKPIQVAKAAYSVALTRQMQEYVPEAELVRLDFDIDPKHPEILYPVLEVNIP